MALPSPTKPTRPGLNAPNQTLQRHLPSPVITTTKPKQIDPVQSINTVNEEKQPQNNSSITNTDTIPIVFDTKYNTKDIDWNELHHLAITKGRTIYVQNILQSHYILQQNDNDKNNWSIKQKVITNESKDNNGDTDATIYEYTHITNLCDSILKFMYQIFTETPIVLNAHNLLHSHTNWETQVDNYDGISVYYRPEDSKNGIHSIKTHFISKCHPVELICVINEFDLIKEIVTIIPMETKYLKQFNNLNKVMYSKINMWWPLKNRDTVVHVRAYDLLNEYDEILIWGKSIEELDGVDIPDLAKGTLRLDVSMAEGVIKPKLMEDGRIGTEVISSFNVDFKTFLPKNLLNWITRTFAYYICKMIRQRTENLKGTTHEQRIKENDIYKDWTKTFEEWKEKKLAENKDENNVEDQK